MCGLCQLTQTLSQRAASPAALWDMPESVLTERNVPPGWSENPVIVPVPPFNEYRKTSPLLRARSAGADPDPVLPADAASSFKEPSASIERLLMVPLPVFAVNAILPLRVVITQQAEVWVVASARVIDVTAPSSASE